MLNRETILGRLCLETSGFAITPIIDAEQQVGTASVDLRLGPDFIVTRRSTGLATFDPARVDEITQRVKGFQDYVRRPPGSSFYLHPGEFALARTLEFVTLPFYMSGQVTGRSSWGRLGLVIATAAHVEPRFQGTITLELANLGTVPIVLYVGVRIAQVVLFDVCEPPNTAFPPVHADEPPKTSANDGGGGDGHNGSDEDTDANRGTWIDDGARDDGSDTAHGLELDESIKTEDD